MTGGRRSAPPYRTRSRRPHVDPAQVIAIGTDFTSCTVLPTTADGVPLAEQPAWADRPHAWPKLWKHHAAQDQADRVNALAHRRGEPWIRRYGGRISAEWQYAKALQVLEEDPQVYAACARWIEAADWIVWQLTGSESRNSCTASTTRASTRTAPIPRPRISPDSTRTSRTSPPPGSNTRCFPSVPAPEP